MKLQVLAATAVADEYATAELSGRMGLFSLFFPLEMQGTVWFHF